MPGCKRQRKSNRTCRVAGADRIGGIVVRKGGLDHSPVAVPVPHHHPAFGAGTGLRKRDLVGIYVALALHEDVDPAAVERLDARVPNLPHRGKDGSVGLSSPRRGWDAPGGRARGRPTGSTRRGTTRRIVDRLELPAVTRRAA